MRDLKTIEATLAQDTGPSGVLGTEVALMCAEVKRSRRSLAEVAERSSSGEAVRIAQRALKLDLLGVENPAAATGLDGYAIRPLATYERAIVGHGDRAAGLTAREVRTLISEIGRLRRALYQAAQAATACPRTRRYVEKTLAKAPWASQTDAASYPPTARR